MTVHQAIAEIDATARDLVRDLDWSKPAAATKALLIVDRVSEIRRALGVPEEADRAAS